MVEEFAESGRLKSGQFAEMALQSLLFCEVQRSCAQTYPQKMGVEFFCASADIAQSIENSSLCIFS